MENPKFVLRGGAFSYDERLVRCADHCYNESDDRDNNLGFRVVLSLSSHGETAMIFNEYNFIRIEQGEFLMGSDKEKDPDAWDDETPMRTVVLDEYWIGQHPVTVQEYGRFVEATSYEPSAKALDAGRLRPVTYISHHDAVAYCEWLTSQLREVAPERIADPSLSDEEVEMWKQIRDGLVVATLPTEEQWEKAARGTDGRKFPWGNEPPEEDHANFNMNVGHVTDIGSYPEGVSPYGVHDMAGNVLEWTSSVWEGDE